MDKIYESDNNRFTVKLESHTQRVKLFLTAHQAIYPQTVLVDFDSYKHIRACGINTQPLSITYTNCGLYYQSKVVNFINYKGSNPR